MDAEHGELCHKLVAKLARKRPSPLERGDLRIWAGAVIYTLGSINFLFDRSQSWTRARCRPRFKRKPSGRA